MFLTMLGVGNGFSPGVYDNNALIERGEHKTLIDCGVTALDSLRSIGLSDNDVQRIFLTHIHFDHAGGLEPFALHAKYFHNRSIELIVPAPIRQTLWTHYLSAGLTTAQPDASALEDFFSVVSPAEGEVFDLCGGLSARWVQTRHVPGKFSCGLVIAEKIFYTSDMVADPALLERLYAEGIRLFLHDCCMGDSPVHANMDQIKAYPQHIRACVCLMHHGMISPAFDIAGMRVMRQHQRMDMAAVLHADHAAQAHPLACFQPEADAAVQKTIAHMRALQSAESTGHDYAHTRRVYQMALQLGNVSEKPVDMHVVALAALLHDIEDWKFSGGDESAGPRAAGTWLESLGETPSVIEHVQEIILDLSFKGVADRSWMKTPEGEIVQDADRLDAIGAIGIARVFATGSALGNIIFDADLPPRTAMDKAQYKDRSVQASSINHFYEKLLHLKELMNTPAAKAIAEQRHRFMIQYLQTLYAECGVAGGLHDTLLSEY